MLRALLFLMLALAIFSSCVEEPKNIDAATTIDQVIADQRYCGDGIVQSWEVCDSHEQRYCSVLAPDLYISGNILCTNDCQEIDLSDCYSYADCRTDRCSSAGSCEQGASDIFCVCDYEKANLDCSGCIGGYYFKDGECLVDTRCEEANCSQYQTCEIAQSGAAYCKCKTGREGVDCADCKADYHLEGADCVQNRPCTSTSCTHYELCNSSSGVPVCSCNNIHHDPENCAECLPGYAMETFSCIDRKTVMCVHDPAAPIKSHDILKSHEIMYTEKSGWESVPFCEWECDNDLVRTSDDQCLSLVLWQRTFPKKVIDIAIADDGSLYILAQGESPNNPIILHAITPENTEKWSLVLMESSMNPGDINVVLRPDQNIYVLGNIITPDGALVYADLPITGPEHEAYTGPVAVSTDGTLFHKAGIYDSWGRHFLSDVVFNFPVIGPHGDIGDLDGSGRLRLLSPDGKVAWTQNSPWLNNETLLSMDADGSIYYIYSFVETKTLYKTTIDGIKTELLNITEFLNVEGSVWTPILIDSGGILYFISSVGDLYALTPSGDLNWKKSISREPTECYYMSPILAKDTVLAAAACDTYWDITIFLSVFDKNGSLVQEYTFVVPDYTWLSRSRIVLSEQGILYFVLYNYVYATQPLSLQPDHDAPWPSVRHDARNSRNVGTPQFNHAPSYPTAPSPQDTATLGIPPEFLIWDSSNDDDGDVVTYDVRFGIVSSNLPTIVSGHTFPYLEMPTISGPATYSWQVLAKDSHGSVTFSDIWSFTITE